MNLNQYKEFVETVTIKQSNNFDDFNSRMKTLNENDLKVNIPLLLTGSCGLGAETGEFTEIVKKMLFQGKPLNEDNVIT